MSLHSEQRNPYTPLAVDVSVVSASLRVFVPLQFIHLQVRPMQPPAATVNCPFLLAGILSVLTEELSPFFTLSCHCTVICGVTRTASFTTVARILSERAIHAIRQANSYFLEAFCPRGTEVVSPERPLSSAGLPRVVTQTLGKPLLARRQCCP